LGCAADKRNAPAVDFPSPFDGVPERLEVRGDKPGGGGSRGARLVESTVVLAKRSLRCDRNSG
jgi:hypothetical protein